MKGQFIILNRIFPNHNKLQKELGFDKKFNFRIYNAGGQPQLDQVYTGVTFPVQKTTNMISPLVKWNHTISWPLPLYVPKDVFGGKVGIKLSDPKYAHMEGHKVNESIFIPGMGYLVRIYVFTTSLLLLQSLNNNNF